VRRGHPESSPSDVIAEDQQRNLRFFRCVSVVDRWSDDITKCVGIIIPHLT